MPPGLSQFPISKSTQSGSWCHLHPINQPPILACSFGTVGRSRTHVLSESFFPNDIKLTYFLGLDTETFFPPNKKGFWELLWAQNGVWSHQKVDLPNSGSFFGWSKKGSGLTRLVGQVSFPSRILFFLWKEKVLTSHKFYRTANNRGPRRLWNIVEKFYVTQWILFARSKKRIGRLFGIHKTTKTPPAFGTRVPERTFFAFCVLVVVPAHGRVDLEGPLRWHCNQAASTDEVCWRLTQQSWAKSFSQLDGLDGLDGTQTSPPVQVE